MSALQLMKTVTKKLAGQLSVTGYAKEFFYISIRLQILNLVLASHRLQSG